MDALWDPLLLSRIQFAFTITFHILFPSLSIGLAGFLVVLEILWLKTGDARWWRLLRFWTTIFALSFGMGVVSGVVLSYQFGTNWSGLMAKAGQIMGPLLAYETLTAFFLEASFLGVLLFGWRKVTPRTHLFATLMVALGTCISAFWITASNSWMQTPAGFAVRNGVYVPVDWLKIVFNPSLPIRYVHMLVAAFLATAMGVAGVAAWYLRASRFTELARPMLRLALGMVVVLAPLQVVVGDAAGLVVRDYQPAKLAAIEAQWDTGVMPLRLFAWPDMASGRNALEVGIPRLGSLITEHALDAPVTGLKAFPAADRPDARIVFWSFRVMVGIGFMMLGLGLWAGWLAWRGRLETHRTLLALLVCAAPSGFVAIVAGWYTAEVGRQPWVVYGFLRTADALSPVAPHAVGLSLALYVLVYLALFGAGLGYMLRAIRRGPVEVALPARTTMGGRPLAAAPDAEA